LGKKREKGKDQSPFVEKDHETHSCETERLPDGCEKKKKKANTEGAGKKLRRTKTIQYCRVEAYS